MSAKFSDFGPVPGPVPGPELGSGLEEAGPPAAPTTMMRTSSAPGLLGAM
jgi:hypothetical protein